MKALMQEFGYEDHMELLPPDLLMDATNLIQTNPTKAADQIDAIATRLTKFAQFIRRADEIQGSSPATSEGVIQDRVRIQVRDDQGTLKQEVDTRAKKPQSPSH